MKLIIKTDYWGYETFWWFLTGTNIIKSRSTAYCGNQQTHNEDIGCVYKNVVHTFMIQYIYGNGIYSPCVYWLYVEDSLVSSGYNFKKSATHAIPSKFNSFMLKLKTDNYFVETSWDLKKDSSIVLGKGQYIEHLKETYEETMFISSYCHTFLIQDSWGDGIFCGNG